MIWRTKKKKHFFKINPYATGRYKLIIEIGIKVQISSRNKILYDYYIQTGIVINSIFVYLCTIF